MRRVSDKEHSEDGKWYHGKIIYLKGKVSGWGLYSTEALWLIVLLTPKGVPLFISRGAAHQPRTAASASEGRNYRWNLANNPVIHVSW
jgi:hypothetical protein